MLSTGRVERSASRISQCISMVECVKCNILLLGKMGHGKSTLGNRMLDDDRSFKVNDQTSPQTITSSSLHVSADQHKSYQINVYDHNGLFEGNSSAATLYPVVSRELNLVIFMLKHGCSFDEKAEEILGVVLTEWKISRISALVLTHCERLSKDEREKIIEKFKQDHPSVAELMGKGILAVGFPDNSHIQPGSQLSQRVEEDKSKLKQLIYSCDETVVIPQTKRNWCSIS